MVHEEKRGKGLYSWRPPRRPERVFGRGWVRPGQAARCFAWPSRPQVVGELTKTCPTFPPAIELGVAFSVFAHAL